MWEIIRHKIYIDLEDHNLMLGELQDIGMDDKESQIYRALLQLKKGSVNDLLKKLVIERRTIYDVLERLIQKGYASSYEENGTKMFLPTSPRILLEDLDTKRERFSKMIPQLESLSQAEEAVRVEVLKGKQGIKTIFLEIQRSGNVHYAFGNVSHFVEKLDIDTKRFLSNIESKGYKEKIIYPKGDKILKIKNGEYRILDSDKMPPIPVIIYGNITCLFVFGDPIQIIKITSKEVTNSYMKQFNMYWGMAKEA